MGRTMDGRLLVLPLLFMCALIHFQPIVFSGLTYWDVSPAWSFYSGTGSNSGPVSFQTDIIATDIHPDGTLVQFTDFSMGTTWTNIGFHAPLGGSMLVTNVGSNEVRFTATPSGATLETFNVYVAGKGAPGSVSGGVDHSFSATDQVVSVRTDVTDSITVSWAALPPSGGGTTPPTIPPDGGDGGIIIVPGDWWQEKGAFLIAGLVICAILYRWWKKPSSEERKRDAFRKLIGRS